MLRGPDPGLGGSPIGGRKLWTPVGTDTTRAKGRVPVSDGLRYGLVVATLDRIVRVKMYDLCRGLKLFE